MPVRPRRTRWSRRRTPGRRSRDRRDRVVPAPGALPRRPPCPRRRASRRRPFLRAGAGAPEQKPADVNKPVGIWQPPHYDEGFVLVSTPDSAPLPYLLKLNHVSQFKYTNTLAVHPTYVTHLGEVKDVNKRNDFQLTRDVFYFSGYVFDKRLDYNIILYTSSADSDRGGGRLRRLRVPQGVRAARRILLAAEPARHDRHLPLLRGHGSQHGGQLHAARIHPGRLGHRRAASRASTTSRWSATRSTRSTSPPRGSTTGSPTPSRSGTTSTTSARPGTTTSTTSRRPCASAPPSPTRARIASPICRTPTPRTTRPICRTARCCSERARWRPTSPSRWRASTSTPSTSASSTGASPSTSSSPSAGWTTSSPTGRCRSPTCSTGASRPRWATSCCPSRLETVPPQLPRLGSLRDRRRGRDRRSLVPVPHAPGLAQRRSDRDQELPLHERALHLQLGSDRPARSRPVPRSILTSWIPRSLALLRLSERC